MSDSIQSRDHPDTLVFRYSRGGGHTHIRVFMNGGKSGDLCLRNEEFDSFKKFEDGRAAEGSGGRLLFVNDAP